MFELSDEEHELAEQAMFRYAEGLGVKPSEVENIDGIPVRVTDAGCWVIPSPFTNPSIDHQLINTKLDAVEKVIHGYSLTLMPYSVISEMDEGEYMNSIINARMLFWLLMYGEDTDGEGDTKREN